MTDRGRSPRGLAGIVLLAVLATAAPSPAVRAQPAGTPPAAPAAADPRPWAAGVAEDEQTIALGFYQQGNDDFLQSRFPQALAHYRQALAHWDHPAIRFNMAVCLINVNQPLEARDALERALAYGAAPLGDDVYVQGQTYRKLLDAQLARLTLRCNLAGADVSLDGRAVLTGPGEVSMHLVPGDHQIVASRAGYLTTSERLTLVAGTSATHDVNLYVMTDVGPQRTIRRWAPWKPYAVIGGGVAVAVAGGLVHSVAVDDFADYDDGIRAACPRGCSSAGVAALTELAALDATARRERNVAIALFATGASVAAAGVLGLYLNRPRLVAVTDDATALGPALGPVLVPVPLTGGAAVALTGRF
jgi:hypothetical protein